MGKSIRSGKKHKKLKFVDPCYSGPARQLNKKNLQWNQPPVAEDSQEVSRHMEELIQSKNKKFKRKKKKVIKDDYIIVKNEIVDKMEDFGGKKTRKGPSVLRQKSYESESQFLNRIQKMADAAIAEAKVESKYNIELMDIDKQGNATYRAAPQMEEEEVADRKKEKRKKRKEKLEEKKRSKINDKEFDLKKEHIQFGEVVSAPPTFKAKPRKAPELNKAGSRQLALKKFLPSHSQAAEKKVAPPSTKWKTLPPEKRKVMENERLRAVQMYRLLKNKKS